jgi:hypothetical protein
MIISFKSKEIELIFQGRISFRHPENIQIVAPDPVFKFSNPG